MNTTATAPKIVSHLWRKLILNINKAMLLFGIVTTFCSIHSSICAVWFWITIFFMLHSNRIKNPGLSNRLFAFIRKNFCIQLSWAARTCCNCFQYLFLFLPRSNISLILIHSGDTHQPHWLDQYFDGWKMSVNWRCVCVCMWKNKWNCDCVCECALWSEHWFASYFT